MSEETKTIVTVGLLLFAAIAWLWPLLLGMHLEMEERKKRKEPPQYDERQRLSRMRAGSHALYAVLGFLLVWAALDQLGRFDWTGSILDMTLCAMLLAWCVWASDCILHDAFVTWKDKRKDADVLSLNYCGLMIFWTRPDSGLLCESWLPMIFSISSTAVLLGICIYKARKRKKAEIEDAL